MPFSRRQFIGSLALPAFAAKKKPAPLAPPNFVMLLADNVPAWALGAYGNKAIRTPNLDRLAQTGLRFRNHATASPAPEPGRATLLTGRTALQTGDAATLDKLLTGAGYASSASGAADAAKWLDAQTAAKPFLLTVNLTSPRAPYGDVPQQYRAIYATERFADFSREPAAPNARRDREMLGDFLGNLRKYAAAVSALDAEAQTVLAKVYDRRLVDQTVVVFTSTCGALLGHHGLWDAGEGSTPVNMYAESVTTPMIWSWVGHVPPQIVRPEIVGNCDFLPTVCELAGASLPAGNWSGRSYLPLVTGKPLPKKQPWRSTDFAWLQDTGMAWVERYKLVERNPATAPGELYDLVADPGEQTNQYANQQFLSVRTQLSGELSAWKQKYSA